MDAFQLIEQLRRGVDTNSPPDKTDALMWEAADKIETLQEWCRKLIESGKFPGEIGNPLHK